MRRRKRARVVWLPVDINNRLGRAPNPASAGGDSSHFIKAFTLNPLGDDPITEEIPLVLDQQTASIGGTTAILTDKTLADVESSGYRLRRIVGKLFFGIGQTTDRQLGDVTSGIVTAGLIIRRTAPNGDSVASVAGGANGTLLNVASLDNIADPWIWRRSWMLSNLLDPQNTDNLIFPLSSNILCGSALDGPHIDQKTARIVGPEERLYLSVTCSGIDGNSQTEPLLVILVGDLRILASMRSSVGNRRNATR